MKNSRRANPKFHLAIIAVTEIDSNLIQPLHCAPPPPKTKKSVPTAVIHSYTNVTLAIVSVQNTVVKSRSDVIIAREVSLFLPHACYEVTDFMLLDQEMALKRKDHNRTAP
jgi:hypothetical protein